jgi:hypothetical protein
VTQQEAKVLAWEAWRDSWLMTSGWAKHGRIPVHPEPVTDEDYQRHGKLGPKMRNRRMAQRVDGGLAWWDGTSGGTSDMVARLVARDRPVRVIPWRRR